MNFTPLKPAYDRDGYVIVRQLLAPAEFAELNRNLERYMAEIVPGLAPEDAFYEVDKSHPESLRQLYFHRTADPFFEAFREHPRWVALAEALVGEPVGAARQIEWFNKPPGSPKGTPPHQDNYYFKLEPCHVLTMWMALDAVDEENACMRYVPGSHALPTRPHGRGNVLGFSQAMEDWSAADEAREVPMVLQPGDIAVHHGNLIHRAGANRSATRHRRALAMVFQGVSCRRDEAAFAAYLAAVQAQQQALGMRRAPPADAPSPR